MLIVYSILFFTDAVSKALFSISEVVL